MKNIAVVIISIIAVAIAFYFLGKKSGAGQTKTDIVQNVALVQEIAQLASLEVNGTTNIRISNKGQSSDLWNKVKNYFAENTLQVSVPYEAKYGVDMRNQKMTINTKAGTATIYLPPVKMLTMQLRLDKMESMQQTGIFSSVSIEEFVKAQKDMYAAANATLENNAAYIKLAEANIKNTLNKYYVPLGYKTNVLFGETAHPGNLK